MIELARGRRCSDFIHGQNRNHGGCLGGGNVAGIRACGIGAGVAACNCSMSLGTSLLGYNCHQFELFMLI